MSATNLRWPAIIVEAARIARSYSTAVTLRQLHYRLVALALYGYLNNLNCYKRLSELTAEARRQGTFPALSDRTRGVHRPPFWNSPQDGIKALAEQYRRNYTEGQEHQVWVIYEKATLGAQIESWLRPFGVPSAALRGYSSESLEREVFMAMENDKRPIVVFYVGDFDPEGEDIERNFKAQAIRWSRGEEWGKDEEDELFDLDETLLDHQDVWELEFVWWEKLTVTPPQVQQFGLVPNPGKASSSRAAGFIRKHGSLFQIEVEAVDPNVLRDLILDAVTDARWFNEEVWDESVALAEIETEKLKKAATWKRLAS